MRKNRDSDQSELHETPQEFLLRFRRELERDERVERARQKDSPCPCCRDRKHRHKNRGGEYVHTYQIKCLDFRPRRDEEGT